MEVDEHIKVKEQLVVRKDMEVDEHARLSNIRHSKGTSCSKKG